LSGSHVNAGAAVALSSLGSALAIAMMVVGHGGTPPLAALLGPDWIRAPGPAPCVLFGSKTLSTLNAQPPELKRVVL